MVSEPTIEQMKLVLELNAGDTVLLTNGQTAEFVKLNVKKFVGIMGGNNYVIPISMYKETIKRIDTEKANLEKSKKQSIILKALKKGDWFYIVKNGDAILYKFDSINTKTIVGINPVGNISTKINMSFEFGLIE
jgi:hypothetical protein